MADENVDLPIFEALGDDLGRRILGHDAALICMGAPIKPFLFASPHQADLAKGGLRMPEISRFLGIVIAMFYREHGVPHIHAVYREHEISVEVESGVVHGSFPPRALRHVLEWAALHERELLDNWDLAREAGRSIVFRPWSEAMDYHVIEARYLGGHVVWLRFRDGVVGEIDLGPALEGPVFEPLRDPTYFKAFTIHPEFHTLVWPNGADFAPEFLHDNVQVAA